MSSSQTPARERATRTGQPVQAEFEGARFTSKDFYPNLGEQGVFLPTDVPVPLRTRGSLTIRPNQYDEPFTIQVEVVRVIEAGGGEYEGRAGLGLMWTDMTPAILDKLERVVDGTRDGSVVESIRRAVRESGQTLEQHLRKRPTDQKLMFAMQADSREIEALIKDGNPVVLTRLLKSPRLQIPQVRQLTRDPRVTTPVLLDIRQKRAWIEDDEILFNFCKHPRAPVPEVKKLLVNLALPKIRELMLAPSLHPEVRAELKKFSRGR